jgi:hypothetical protein
LPATRLPGLCCTSFSRILTRLSIGFGKSLQSSSNSVPTYTRFLVRNLVRNHKHIAKFCPNCALTVPQLIMVFGSIFGFKPKSYRQVLNHLCPDFDCAWILPRLCPDWNLVFAPTVPRVCLDCVSTDYHLIDCLNIIAVILLSTCFLF